MVFIFLFGKLVRVRKSRFGLIKGNTIKYVIYFYS